MNISMELENDRITGLVKKVYLNLQLPEGFPKKYESAIIKSMELCSVKKHLQNPPEFEITAN
jgi:ribosomal protein S12 methylthiotransferase accessory factor